MTYTNARHSYPSIFSLSSVGSTGTFVDCAGVIKITPPHFTRNTVDVTDMNSTDYYEDNIAGGPIRTGTVTFDAHYLSTNSQQTTVIKDCFVSGARVGWKITFAGTSSNHIMWGDGTFTEYGFNELTQDGKISITFGMKTRGTINGPASSTTT